MKFTGDWNIAKKLFSTRYIEKTLSNAQEITAQLFVSLIKQNILSMGASSGNRFVDNAESTVLKKGFNYPLIETGALLNSVGYKKVNNEKYEIGVYKTDKTGTVNVAAVLEFGAVIKRGASIIIIPARPYISTIINNENIVQLVADLFYKKVMESF